MKRYWIVLCVMLLSTARIAVAEEKEAVAGPVTKEDVSAAEKTESVAADQQAEQANMVDEPCGQHYGLSGSLVLLYPRAEGWDNTSGLEFKGYYWLDETWGIAGVVSRSEWSFEEDPLDVVPPDWTPLRAEGDVDLLSFGASVCYRRPVNEMLEVVVEPGLRYVVVDSEIEISTEYRDYFRRDVSYSTYVENENHIMGVMGVSLLGRFLEKGVWMVGGDFRFDIDDGGDNWLKQNIGNDFDALAARAGVGIEW